MRYRGQKVGRATKLTDNNNNRQKKIIQERLDNTNPIQQIYIYTPTIIHYYDQGEDQTIKGDGFLRRTGN